MGDIVSLKVRYQNQGSCCYYCKESIKLHKITRDHIEPKCLGYTLEKNMVFACKTCNNLKGNYRLPEFIQILEIKVSALIRSAGGEQFGSLNPKVVYYRQVIKSSKELLCKIIS